MAAKKLNSVIIGKPTTSTRKPTTFKKTAPAPVNLRKPKAKAGPKVKQIFVGKVMVLAGEFPDEPHEKIGGWITTHGGQRGREVTEDTTHLICTIEEYKKKTTAVRRAWALSTEHCQIVVIDWLYACLDSKNKRCRSEKGYTLDRISARIKKGKTKHEALRKKFAEGPEASKQLCDSKQYQFHYDSDGFVYKVVLSRVKLGGNTNGKILIEKYTLCLFESIRRPPILYMCGAIYSRPHHPTTFYRDQCHAMDCREAFKHFKHFFKEKTGVEWDMRLEKEQYNIAAASAGEKRLFRYMPPVLGRPTGFLPPGYIRPELREENEVESSESEQDVFYDNDSDLDSDDGDGDTGEDSSQRSEGLETGSETMEGSRDGSYESAGSMTMGSASGSTSTSDYGGLQSEEEEFVDEGYASKNTSFSSEKAEPEVIVIDDSDSD